MCVSAPLAGQPPNTLTLRLLDAAQGSALQSASGWTHANIDSGLRRRVPVEVLSLIRAYGHGGAHDHEALLQISDPVQLVVHAFLLGMPADLTIERLTTEYLVALRRAVSQVWCDRGRPLTLLVYSSRSSAILSSSGRLKNRSEASKMRCESSCATPWSTCGLSAPLASACPPPRTSWKKPVDVAATRN